MNLPRAKLNPKAAGFNAIVDRVTVSVFANAGELLLSKANARRLIEEFVREIGDVAEKTGRCAIPGLGVLYRAQSKARNVRNQHTKEMMRLPARWSLRMRAAKSRKGPDNGPA